MPYIKYIHTFTHTYIITYIHWYIHTLIKATKLSKLRATLQTRDFNQSWGILIIHNDNLVLIKSPRKSQDNSYLALKQTYMDDEEAVFRIKVLYMFNSEILIFTYP